MARRILAIGITILAGSALTAGAAAVDDGAPRWTRDAAQQTAHAAAADARLEDLLNLARTDAAALPQAVQRLRDDGGLSAPARERVLRDFARGLRELAPTATRRASMDALADYRSRVRVPLPEHRRSVVPLYRVAAAARGTLHTWQRRGAKRWAAQTLEDQPSIVVERFAQRPGGDRDPVQLGLLAAVDAASQSHREALADELRGTLEARPSLVPLALRVAAPLGDTALFERALAGADTLTARHALPVAVQRFPAQQAFALLRAASRRNALASPAYGQMARLLPELPDARDFLLARLGDPEHGAAAAAALAQALDPGTIRRLGTVLESNATYRLRARAALALHLASTDPAQEVLASFVARAKAPDRLSAEVAKWLAD